jgi:hypothetical protein
VIAQLDAIVGVAPFFAQKIAATKTNAQSSDAFRRTSRIDV